MQLRNFYCYFYLNFYNYKLVNFALAYSDHVCFPNYEFCCIYAEQLERSPNTEWHPGRKTNWLITGADSEWWVAKSSALITFLELKYVFCCIICNHVTCKTKLTLKCSVKKTILITWKINMIHVWIEWYINSKTDSPSPNKYKK